MPHGFPPTRERQTIRNSRQRIGERRVNDNRSQSMAEPYVVKMPKLSDTMTEGTVVTWEKQPGDKIERGTIIATVETDKAIMDVEVFREGFLSGPLVPANSVVPVGEPIAYIVQSKDEVKG